MKKEIEFGLRELLQNGVTIDNSLSNPDFDTREFYQVYSELNPPPRTENVVIARDGLLKFLAGDRHGYILFALRDINKGTFRAVASLKTHKFETAPVLIKNGDSYEVKDFNQVVKDVLGLKHKSNYFLEFSGCVVSKEYRRKGYASLLTELRYGVVSDAISEKRLVFIDEDLQQIIDPMEVIRMLVARGDLQGDPNLKRLKDDFGHIGTNIPEDQIISYGLDLQKIGTARVLSIPTQKIAEKRGMTYSGINFTDGGPVYVMSLLNGD